MAMTMKAFLLTSLLCIICVSCQELPSIFPTALGPPVRHNFCERHYKVDSGNVTRQKSLEGMELHVALFNYQLDKETGGIKENPGISEKILDELAIRAGFTWRNSYGTVSSPTGNETWTSVLNYAVDTYDLLGDWYLRTTERLNNGILFPEGWYDGSLIMVRKKSEVSDKFAFLSFLRPFTPGVWLVLVAVTLISGVVMFFLEQSDDKRLDDKMKFGFIESLFSAAFLFVGHFSGHPRTNATRIMSFSLCFVYFIMTAAYTANLASFLVVKNSPAISINAAEDAVKNGQRFCVMRSSTSDKFMVDNFPTARLVRQESIDETYEALQNDQCDIVLTTVDTYETKRRTKEFNEECNLEWVGRVVSFTTAGYTLRDSEQYCSSLLRDVIDLHMIEMKADGRFQQIWDGHREKSTTNACMKNGETNEDDDENDPRLSLKNTGGIFIIHAAAMVLALYMSLIKLNKTGPGACLVNRKKETEYTNQRRSSFGSDTFEENHMESANIENAIISSTRESPTPQTAQEDQLKLLQEMFLEMCAENQFQDEEMNGLRENMKAMKEGVEAAGITDDNNYSEAETIISSSVEESAMNSDDLRTPKEPATGKAVKVMPDAEDTTDVSNGVEIASLLSLNLDERTIKSDFSDNAAQEEKQKKKKKKNKLATDVAQDEIVDLVSEDKDE